jgi:hypothetical protein
MRRGTTGLRELGIVGDDRPRAIDPVWFNVPTGPRRRTADAQVPLAEVVRVAHLAGGTINDVVLAAVSGALLATAGLRGPPPHELVVSVPISSRRAATAADPGNSTGVRPIAVPGILDDRARLAAIVRRTRAVRDLPRASSSGPLGVAFRLLARLGLFGLFIDRQRLVHTFETNLRGPSEPVRLGATVSRIVPITVTWGNVAISFAVLSYAGRLGTTVIADPDVLADPQIVADELSARLARLGVRAGA